MLYRSGIRKTDTADWCNWQHVGLIILSFSSSLSPQQSKSEILMKHVPDIAFEPMINIAHNYAAWEHHFGQNVIVHRKSATRARKGEIGIIPGSMGTSSFIVEGLGNPESFESCSHGAGRVMGRKDACRRLELKDQQHIMDSQNIVRFMKNSSSWTKPPVHIRILRRL